MEVKRLGTLGLEVFKTLNNLNPALMKEIFRATKWFTHRPNNVQVNAHKTAKYRNKDFRTLGHHIQNSLSDNIDI